MNESLELQNLSENLSDNPFFILDENSPLVSATDKILFKSATDFSIFITDLAQKNGDTLTQTILDYCEDRDLDPSDISKLVSKSLKDRLAVEMRDVGLLPKESTAATF